MDIFVYGTLTEPETVGNVVESFAFLGSAVLSGLHPVEGRYPSLAPGGKTGGRLLRTDEIAALDAYEGVDDGPYVRVAVPLAGADGTPVSEAAVYVGDPDRLDVVEPVTWPGTGSFADSVEQYIRENTVRVERRRA